MSLQTEKKPLTRLSELRQLLSSFEQIPSYEENPDFYQDWSQKGDFVLKVGKGECAV